MKYVLLIHENEAQMSQMSKENFDELIRAHGNFAEELKKSGHQLGGMGLKPSSTATTVRVRNGKLLTTDGPYAETREQLGGFYIIETKDLDEAIAIAARLPGMERSSVEIRPALEVD